MKPFVIVGAVLAFAAVRAASQEPESPPPASADHAAEFDRLASEHADALIAYREESRERFKKMFEEAEAAAASRRAAEEAGQKPPSDSVPAFRMDGGMGPSPTATFVPKFEDLARRAAGSPSAVQPLLWLVEYAFGVEPVRAPREIGKPPSAPAPSAGRRAWDVLIKNHVDAEELADAADFLRMAAGGPDTGHAEKGLRDLLAATTLRRTKAGATAALARLLYDDEGYEWNDENGAPAMRPKPMAADRLKARKDEAAVHFKKLAKDYGETEYADATSGYLFELENLQVGMTVPDFSFVDSEGVKFKLSDYKGKAVALDFWGYW